MIWAGIINNQIVAPFRVPEGVKVCAKSYVDFLKNFLPWYKEALTKFGFKEARFMLWPACSPDLNPIENFWSILKRKIYEDGKQYSSKNCLWEAIQNCAASVDNSMNNRLIKLMGAKGGYIH